MQNRTRTWPQLHNKNRIINKMNKLHISSFLSNINYFLGAMSYCVLHNTIAYSLTSTNLLS